MSEGGGFDPHRAYWQEEAVSSCLLRCLCFAASKLGGRKSAKSPHVAQIERTSYAFSDELVLVHRRSRPVNELGGSERASSHLDWRSRGSCQSRHDCYGLTPTQAWESLDSINASMIRWSSSPWAKSGSNLVPPLTAAANAERLRPTLAPAWLSSRSVPCQ